MRNDSCPCIGAFLLEDMPGRDGDEVRHPAPFQLRFCPSISFFFEEVWSISGEKESGSNLLMVMVVCSSCAYARHLLCQANSSSSALASCKSFVSNPSVNQP